jgi:hypothetical protein
MATDGTQACLIELRQRDRSLDLLPSPGGVPEEHTFQGELIFVSSIQLEGRILDPPTHRGKRFRAWLSKLWLPASLDELIDDVGSLSERSVADGAEFLANLAAPESALEPATVCLSATWRFLELSVAGSMTDGAVIKSFRLSRNPPKR